MSSFGQRAIQIALTVFFIELAKKYFFQRLPSSFALSTEDEYRIVHQEYPSNFKYYYKSVEVVILIIFAISATGFGILFLDYWDKILPENSNYPSILGFLMFLIFIFSFFMLIALVIGSMSFIAWKLSSIKFKDFIMVQQIKQGWGNTRYSTMLYGTFLFGIVCFVGFLISVLLFLIIWNFSYK